MSNPASLRFVTADVEDTWPAIHAIRTAVFVDEQGCPPDEEFDAYDASCHHVLGYAGEQPVATARWRVVEKQGREVAKLERFAILPEYRGGGSGRRLVGHVIDIARAAGYRHLLVHAQAHLERFYASFGFVVDGEGFEEAGIPHLRMMWHESAPPGAETA